MGQSKWLLQNKNKNKNQTKKTMGTPMNNVLLRGQFCDVAKSGNDLDEDVAKLGYELNLKIEIFKHPFKKIKI
jgi:hypothetical protein